MIQSRRLRQSSLTAAVALFRLVPAPVIDLSAWKSALSLLVHTAGLDAIDLPGFATCHTKCQLHEGMCNNRTVHKQQIYDI